MEALQWPLQPQLLPEARASKSHWNINRLVQGLKDCTITARMLLWVRLLSLFLHSCIHILSPQRWQTVSMIVLSAFSALLPSTKYGPVLVAWAFFTWIVPWSGKRSNLERVSEMTGLHRGVAHLAVFRCLPQNSATPAFAAFSPDPSYPEGFFLILVENSVVEWILVFASIPVKVYATLVLAHHAQRWLDPVVFVAQRSKLFAAAVLVPAIAHFLADRNARSYSIAVHTDALVFAIRVHVLSALKWPKSYAFVVVMLQIALVALAFPVFL
jgi:hypothetical protein